jgi:hypothetical protein
MVPLSAHRDHADLHETSQNDRGNRQNKGIDTEGADEVDLDPCRRPYALNDRVLARCMNTPANTIRCFASGVIHFKIAAAGQAVEWRRDRLGPARAYGTRPGRAYATEPQPQPQPSKRAWEKCPIVKDEMETKWRRVADELRSIARRVLRGPTRDKLFKRADQLEESAVLRRRLSSIPLFSLEDGLRIVKNRH